MEHMYDHVHKNYYEEEVVVAKGPLLLRQEVGNL